MSSLLMRRLAKFGDPGRFNIMFYRCESTQSTIAPASTTTALERYPKPSIHTHFLAIPMYEGTFMERVIQMRDFLRANASLAGLHPDAVMPNLQKTLLFRFGHVNVEGFKPNRPSPEQPVYSLTQVEEALEKARARIDTEIDKDSLTLPWGLIAPVVPYLKGGQAKSPFNPALVKILNLRTQLGPAWDNIKNIQAIVFAELESAGITNVKLRESSSIHLSIINTKWGASEVDGKQQAKPFNLKTLYTIPGFDQFRTTPLPAKDEFLGRFTPVNLGASKVKSFVLEEVGQNIEQITNDPVFTRTYEFA